MANEPLLLFMYTYRKGILHEVSNYRSDVLLSEVEGDRLVGAVLAQIDDPAGVDFMDKRARFSTTITKCQLTNEYFSSTFTPNAATSEES